MLRAPHGTRKTVQCRSSVEERVLPLLAHHGGLQGYRPAWFQPTPHGRGGRERPVHLIHVRLHGATFSAESLTAV